MKTSDYWKKRFEHLETASNSYGLDAFRKIEPAFDKAQRQIQGQIEAWYGRFANNNKITIEEARKLLTSSELKEFKWDVKEYIKYGKENDINGMWMKELENASAKFHISRLEALKVRTQHAAEVAFGNELDMVDSMARKVYTENYYHSIFEVQKGFNLGWEIGQIDERKLDKLISKPWAADGKNFSNRVWGSKTQMVNELHQQLTRTCLLGQAPDDAIKYMSKFVDKKFKNAKVQAGRLVMTEQAYFHSVSQKDAFNDLDVEEFEVVATLDSHTSEVCQEMDGKRFPMKDYEPGVTAPPFHVWCRSVTVPWFDDEFNLTERAARDEDGNTYYVPSDMTYKDWKKSMVDGDVDNLKVTNNKENLTNVSLNDTMKVTKNITGSGGIITSAKDASDFDGLSDYLDSTYGVKMDDSVKQLDFDLVKDGIEGVEEVISEYPDVGLNLTEVITNYSGVMSCSGETLTFNPNYFTDKQHLIDTCNQMSNIKHWIPNSSPKSLGVHEAAHGVEWTLIDANPSYVYNFEKTNAWNDCTEAKTIVSQACKNIKKTPYGKGKKKVELIQAISKYALDTDSETLAESFADVYANGTNANPLSIEIKRLTKEQMKKYKGVI